MTPGRITLTGIRAHGRHGVLDSERRLGQPFSADVVLEVDMPEHDDLSETVDYTSVARVVRDDIAGEPVNLVETLACRIGDDVLAVDARIRAVEVSVHKPQAPVGVLIDDVVVTCRKEAA